MQFINVFIPLMPFGFDASDSHVCAPLYSIWPNNDTWSRKQRRPADANTNNATKTSKGNLPYPRWTNLIRNPFLDQQHIILRSGKWKWREYYIREPNSNWSDAVTESVERKFPMRKVRSLISSRVKPIIVQNLYLSLPSLVIGIIKAMSHLISDGHPNMT